MEDVPGITVSGSQLQLTSFKVLNCNDDVKNGKLVNNTVEGNGTKIAATNEKLNGSSTSGIKPPGNQYSNGNASVDMVTGTQTEEISASSASNGDSSASTNDEELEQKKKAKLFGCFSKKKDKEKPKMVSTLQLFRFATKLDVFFMVVGTVCACLHGTALPFMLIVFGDMTDTFVNAAKNSNLTSNVTDPQIAYDLMNNEIRKSSYYYAGIGFGVLIIGYIRVTLWLQTSHRQTFRIRLELLKAVLRQEIGWFDTHDAGELGSRLADDVNKIQEGIGDKFANFFQWFATFVAGIIIGMCYGWKLALVIFSVSPLLALAGGIMNYMITSTTAKELSAYAKAGSVAEEVLCAIRTVVAFGGQQKECERYAKNLVHAKDFGIHKSMVSGAGMGVVFLVIFSSYALAFWYGGKLTRDEPENYTIGVMLIVFFCVVIGAFALGNAAPNLENIGTARGAAYVIWDIIDRIPEIDSNSNEGLVPTALTGKIELKDVVFRYPSRKDVPILNGLSLFANKGQTVALVGSSGCGKSTVVQLLQRFYDPLSGTVLIDGIDIRQLNIKWLRRNIGVVSQEPILFATTIAENIRYGRDGITNEDIERAAKEANAHSFISKLPLKYETLVGERGAQLSGGQKQRIAIARALVRDPRILLLDEATSALDTESEATVQSALDKARMGRTTIVIAHRLSTVKTADIIYGIQQGVAHESGNHAELMEKHGIYYQLVTNQQTMEEAEEHITDEDADARGDPSKSLQRLRTLSVASSHGEHADIVPDGALDDPDQKKTKLKEPSMTRIMVLNTPEIPFIIIGCIAATCQGGIQPVFAIIFSSMLGVFAKPVDEQVKEILFYSMMFIVIGVGSCLAMFFQGWMFGISGSRLTMRLRNMTFKALLRHEISFFDNHDNSTGALTTRLSTDASAIQGATGARLGMMFQSFASIGIGVIIGFIYSWELALFIVGFVPFFLIGGILEMRIMRGFSGKNAALEGAGKVANEAIVNIRTVASLTKEPKFVEDYQKLTSIPYRDSLRKAHILGFTFAFSQSLLFFAYAAIFTFGGWLISHRGLYFESMFKVFSAIIFGAMAVGQASQFAPDYGKAKAAAARVFTLLDKIPSIDSYSTDGEKPSSCQGKIEFSDVHFSYPTRSSVTVLRGLSMHVEPGQTVALVGSSGCGKSTSVQLLERFYDTASGSVLVDNWDVRELSLQWLRSQIGIVSQEPMLFDCSIAENIAYGDNSRTVSMDEIIAAARMANIHTFISSLPKGYDTNVGDKGAQLSGGQKQRIAIARALVRNPKILLLDEATSALDTESEKVVQEALDRAQEGRTSLVIAHRLSTIQNATCIVVIHNGRVAEQGTHSQLMSRRGLYYRLQLAQGLKKL